MARGVDLRKLSSKDLLDVAMSVLVEPLAADPAKVHEFLASTLNPPLDGTDEAVREEQDAVMDMFGGLEAIRQQQAARRAAKADPTPP